MEVLQLSDEEKEKWDEISKKARDAAVQRAIKEFVARMDELIEKYSKDE